MTDSSSRAPARKAMLAKAHIARKELGLDEASYRAIISRISQNRTDSAGKLHFLELEALLKEFRRLGWKGVPSGLPRTAAQDPQSRKIRALWLALHDSGEVRSRDEKALRAYVRRMTGHDDLRFCTPAEKGRLIEALKAWKDRGSHRGNDRGPQ